MSKKQEEYNEYMRQVAEKLRNAPSRKELEKQK